MVLVTAFIRKQRWGKKWQLTRREAGTRFETGKHQKKIKSYQAKQSSQYYPMRGSSEGEIIGARRVDKAFTDMMRALFSIGDRISVSINRIHRKLYKLQYFLYKWVKLVP